MLHYETEKASKKGFGEQAVYFGPQKRSKKTMFF